MHNSILYTINTENFNITKIKDIWKEPGHQKKRKDEENWDLEKKCQPWKVVRLLREEEKKVVKNSFLNKANENKNCCFEKKWRI